MEDAGPQRKRRKGGINQRKRAHENEMMAESMLQGLLMTYLAQGIMSGVQVHAIAKAAKHDMDLTAEGYRLPKLDQLAAIQHGKNLNGSVFNMMRKETNLPKPTDFYIPMKSTDPSAASSSILLPHELFASFYQNENGWRRSILPDSSRLQDFWRIFTQHPCMDNHPLKSRKDWNQWCVPLSLHGDETPITGVGKLWCHKALILSWSSMMAVAHGNETIDCNIYIHGLFEKFMIPDSDEASGTMSVLWKILHWSFMAIWEGFWPSCDWLGHR